LTAANKTYDNSREAVLNGSAVLSGVVGADDVSLAGAPLAVFASADAGQKQPITVSGFWINGSDVDNYSLVQPTGLKADIAPKPVTIPVEAGQTKIYGADDPSGFRYTHTPLIGADSIGGDLARTPGEDVGEFAYQLGALSAGPNYALELTQGAFSITPRPISVTPDGDQYKVFGSPDPTFTYVYPPLINSDVITGELGREPGEDVGQYAYTLGTFAAGKNYTLRVAGDGFFTIVPPQLTTVLVAGFPNPARDEGAVMLTARVVSPESTPLGTVTFKDGDRILGSGDLSAGTATLTISSLTAGLHTITAEYHAPGSPATSISMAITLRVDRTLNLPFISR
jgi:hypothetical protein